MAGVEGVPGANYEPTDIKLNREEVFKRSKDLIALDSAAAQTLAGINEMQRLNDAGGLPEGPLANANVLFRQALAAAGIDTKGAGPAELFRMMSEGKALESAAALKPVSNTDLDFMLRQWASLPDTTYGRKLKLDYTKALNERTMEMVRFMKARGGPTDDNMLAWNQYAAQKPLFSQAPQIQGPPMQGAPGQPAPADPASALKSKYGLE
jgi:hypothetical protein